MGAPSERADPESFPRIRAWMEDIRVRHGHVLEVTLTRNRRTMTGYRPLGNRRTSLRLHQAFERAPDSILRDIESSILRKDRRAWSRVGAYARNISGQTPDAPANARPPILRSRGRHHDLAEILNQVREEYFPGIGARITWSRRGKSSRRRRSIRFGSWNEEQRLVRIHPVLDADWVPEAFLHYLVYHELCHAVAKPIPGSGGKRRIHHPKFRELEARYPNLEEMERISTELFQKIRKLRL